MSVITVAVLTGFIFVGALLYASVGHGGASGYLAAMALLGVSPEVMKPTALVLNILVVAIAAMVGLDWCKIWDTKTRSGITAAVIRHCFGDCWPHNAAAVVTQRLCMGK